MKKLGSSIVVIVSFVAVTSAAGCASTTTTNDPSSVSTEQEKLDTGDATASSAQGSRLDQMLFGSVSTQEPAAAAGNVVTAQWWPAGCASRQRDATNTSVVHVKLTDCTGPFGLVHHSGDITVTFSKNPDGSLHAQAASSDMTINGKAATYSSDSDITVDAATKTVTVKHNGAWTRENAKGETVSHTRAGTTVIDVAAKCRTTNGTGVTKVGAREVDSTLKDYKICRKADGSDACPTGEVTHAHKLSGKTLTVEFDGSAQATLTGPKGSAEIALVCTP